MTPRAIETEVVTVEDRLSIESADRQAFGAYFDKGSHDVKLAGHLLAGHLTMQPHPEWILPSAIDWTADPFRDSNWKFQYLMLRWLDPLRRRAEAGDEAAAQMWIRYAEDWVRQNPPDSPTSPFAWRDMADGIRALEFCSALPFISTYGPKNLDWLVPSIRQHAEWLADPAHMGVANHALHQHQGLFVCGAVLQDAGLRDLAVRRMSELFAENYDAQGINAEGAIAYHFANYHWWSTARRRLELEGVTPPRGMEMLSEAPVALAHATKPSGTFVSIGDTDGGRPKQMTHPAAVYAFTRGAQGEPPADTVKLYESGYLFVRSGWGRGTRAFEDETFLSLAFGRADKVHGHPDGLSLTYSSRGTEWVTDPGKYRYGRDEMRQYCQSRESHSLVYLEGRSYDSGTTVQCVRRHFDDDVYDLTLMDEGYQGVTIRRRLIYSVTGEYIVVLDEVRSEEECTAVQNWQLGHDVNVERQRRGVDLRAGDDARAVLRFTGTTPETEIVRGRENPLAGWVSTGWRTRAPASAIRFRKSGQHFRFITLLAAGRPGVTPEVSAKPMETPGGVHLEIITGESGETMMIDKQSVQISPVVL